MKSKGQDEERTSTGERPIMVLLDLLGRRWTLRVLWELRAGPMTWRKLRSACGGISPNVLQERLHELRRSGVVQHSAGTGYALTEDGRELGAILLPLNEWAKRRADRLSRD